MRQQRRRLLGCRTGGFVGHNEAKITKCENKGVILSDHTLSGTNYHGSGWAAGYNKSADLITECVVGGRVGDYTVYKDNPQSAMPWRSYTENSIRRSTA